MEKTVAPDHIRHHNRCLHGCHCRSDLQFWSLPCMIWLAVLIFTMYDLTCSSDLYHAWSDLQFWSLPCMIWLAVRIFTVYDLTCSSDLYRVRSNLQFWSLLMHVHHMTIYLTRRTKIEQKNVCAKKCLCKNHNFSRLLERLGRIYNHYFIVI